MAQADKVGFSFALVRPSDDPPGMSQSPRRGGGGLFGVKIAIGGVGVNEIGPRVNGTGP